MPPIDPVDIAIALWIPLALTAPLLVAHLVARRDRSDLVYPTERTADSRLAPMPSDDAIRILTDLMIEDRKATEALTARFSDAERANDKRDQNVQVLAGNIQEMKAAWETDADNRAWVTARRAAEAQDHNLKVQVATARHVNLLNAPVAVVTSFFSAVGGAAATIFIAHVKGL